MSSIFLENLIEPMALPYSSEGTIDTRQLLHKLMLEHFLGHNFSKSAQMFAEEAELSSNTLSIPTQDDQGLLVKWFNVFWPNSLLARQNSPELNIDEHPKKNAPEVTCDWTEGETFRACDTRNSERDYRFIAPSNSPSTSDSIGARGTISSLSVICHFQLNIANSPSPRLQVGSWDPNEEEEMLKYNAEHLNLRRQINENLSTLNEFTRAQRRK